MVSPNNRYDASKRSQECAGAGERGPSSAQRGIDPMRQQKRLSSDTNRIAWAPDVTTSPWHNTLHRTPRPAPTSLEKLSLPVNIRNVCSGQADPGRGLAWPVPCSGSASRYCATAGRTNEEEMSRAADESGQVADEEDDGSVDGVRVLGEPPGNEETREPPGNEKTGELGEAPGRVEGGGKSMS